MIVIGEHPQGGEYIWPEGKGPEQLAEPSEDLWDFVIDQSIKSEIYDCQKNIALSTSLEISEFVNFD